jgi:serine/threonine-protein kinase
MKVIKGKTLTEILSSKTPGERTARDLFDQLQIFLKVCDALAFAHSRGVIHQDLKPDNIMIGQFGEVYLMDWGFAKIKKGKSLKKETREVLQGRKRLKITEKKGFVGATLHYLAPEYLGDNPNHIDERTDIFGLGGILYKILSGEPPFHGNSREEVAQKALFGDVPPPEKVVGMDLPSRLSRIAMKALSKRPEDRYKSVTELKEDVERFLQCGWQFERLRFAPGEAIVTEGEHGDAAYIITSGKCRVYRTVDNEDMELGELGVGDVFGELAVFASRPRAATVKAINEVSVMVLEQRHFEDDLGMSFWLGVVVKALAERFLSASAENAALLKQLQKENGS